MKSTGKLFVISILLLIVMLMSVMPVFAEGSAQLGGLLYGTVNPYFWGSQYKLYVFAEAGDTITMSFNAYSTFNVYNPSGALIASAPTTISVNSGNRGFYSIVGTGNPTVWDVSVTNSSGAVVSGRLFAYYFPTSGGYTNVSLYVLTNDGYIFQNLYPFLNAFGTGAFVSTNRGIINTATNTSLYMTTSVTGNNCSTVFCPSAGTFTYNGVTYNYAIPNYTQPASAYNNKIGDKDIVNRMFLNYPDAAVLAELGVSKPLPVATISNFVFNKPYNATPVGSGGDFTFSLTREGSCTVEMTFPNDPTGARTVAISDYCKAGTNTLHWNGKDHLGANVGEGQYTAKLKISCTEVHFIQQDIEILTGMTSRLMNWPADDPDYSSKAGLVFFDNRAYPGDNIYGDPLAGYYGVQKLSGLNTLTTPFAGNYDRTNVDMWSSYAPESSTKTLVYSVSDKGTLAGYVFYDSNKNGAYDTSSASEWGFRNATVQIFESDGTTLNSTLKTDANGYFSKSLFNGNYVVKVTSPDGILTATTALTSAVTVPANRSVTTYYGFVQNPVKVSSPEGNENGDINVKVGQKLSFTIRYKNVYSSVLSSVVITDTIPTGTAFVSMTGYNNGTVSHTNAGELTWTVPNLAVGDTLSVSFTVIVVSLHTGDAINNTATITANNETIKTNTTKNIVNYEKQNAISGDNSNFPNVKIGESIIYTLSIINSSAEAQTNIVISDAAPAGTVFVSMTSYNNCAVNNSNGNLTWTIASLAPSEKAVVTFTVRVTDALVINSIIPNTTTFTVNGKSKESNEVRNIVNYVKKSTIS